MRNPKVIGSGIASTGLLRGLAISKKGNLLELGQRMIARARFIKLVRNKGSNIVPGCQQTKRNPNRVTITI